jgi:hypothetical protein
LSPQQLISIQGADLLDLEDQLQGFKALCGLEGHKPFECVGSIAECRAAMKFLASDSRWHGKKIVRALAVYAEIRQAPELGLLLRHLSQHNIPPAILDKLDAF